VDNSFSHDRCSDTVIRKFAGESLDALNRLNKVSLQGRRYDMPQPMEFAGGKIAADLRPPADGSAVRTSLVACVG